MGEGARGRGRRNYAGGSFRKVTIAPISGLRYMPSSSAGMLSFTRTGTAPLPRSAIGISRSRRRRHKRGRARPLHGRGTSGRP